MQLWLAWWSMVAPLRAACTRTRSFLWLAAALAGLCIRPDLLGVTSIMRALGLTEHCYDRLLDHFHSSAVPVDALTDHWVRRVLKGLPLHRFAGRPVLLGDGLKVAKAGRKMPAVKLLHQPGESNTKPPYIMGHSVQVVSALVGADSSRPARRAHPRGSEVHQPRSQDLAEQVLRSARDTRGDRALLLRRRRLLRLPHRRPTAARQR
jgi:hypothetical protein